MCMFIVLALHSNLSASPSVHATVMSCIMHHHTVADSMCGLFLICLLSQCPLPSPQTLDS